MASKAERFLKITNDVFFYLDTLKQKFSKHSVKANGSFTAKDLESLKGIISGLRKQIQAIDPEIIGHVQNQIALVERSSGSDLQDEFPGTFHLALTNIQVHLKILENHLVEFCDKKVAFFDDSYSIYQAIVYADSKVYRPGETGSVFAGIGSFTYQGHPEIMIHGKKLERSSFGDFEYKFKASSIPGRYLLPVIVKYVDPNTGLPITLKKEIQYSVEQQCE